MRSPKGLEVTSITAGEVRLFKSAFHNGWTWLATVRFLSHLVETCSWRSNLVRPFRTDGVELRWGSPFSVFSQDDAYGREKTLNGFSLHISCKHNISLHFRIAINLIFVNFNLQSMSISEFTIETKLVQVENNIDQNDCYKNVGTKSTMTQKCRNQNCIFCIFFKNR